MRVRPLLCLSLWLATAPLQALPRVHAQDERPVGSGNVGETFLAREGGRLWFFKADGLVSEIQRYGNFEAEVLVGRLLRRLGVRAPQARLVSLAGRRGAYLQAELVDPEFTGGVKPVVLKELRDLPDPGTLDHTELRLLQVVDVLVGNGDRHDGNLFLVERGDRVAVVPIDNNLALATPRVVFGYYNWHLTRGFRGVVAGEDPADPGGLLYPHHADACGKPLRILLRNRLYEASWIASGRRAGGLSEYVRLASRVKALLPDGVLERLVEDLGDEDITVGDPGARRAEILALLRFRRDALPDVFRELVKRQDVRETVGLRWLERSLPERVRTRLGLGENALAFLGARMFSAERFWPREAYYHLRAAGVETLLAREATKLLCEAQGVEFPTKEILLAETGLGAGTYRQAMAEYFERFPASNFQKLHGAGAAAEVPVDLLRVEPRRDGLSYRSARGEALTESSIRPLFGAVKAALREGRPRLGEVLVLERDAFAPGVYRAAVEDDAGRSRWQGRVATGPR